MIVSTGMSGIKVLPKIPINHGPECTMRVGNVSPLRQVETLSEQ